MRSEHRRHDQLLVTRFAMDDAYPSETGEARQLIDSCAECAALAADIRALSTSMSQLPDARRTRDFTITAEKADELRGSRISRWMRGLATPKFGLLRPVAGVALSIGLVMAIVGVAMPGTAPAGENTSGAALIASATDNSAPAAQDPDAGAPEPGAGAPEFPVPETPALAAPPEVFPLASAAGGSTDIPDDVRVEEASPDPASEQLNQAYVQPSPGTGKIAEGNEFAAATPADTSRNILLYAGLAIAAISVLLLALAWFARRYFADPLLR
jgi:hypothetical protein